MFENLSDSELAGLKGAASGAATGASMGSVIGPWGTAIGAVAGGAIGGITSYTNSTKLTAKTNKLKNDALLENIKSKMGNISTTSLGNNNSLPYYKYGGKVPISSTGVEFVGASHANGGIKTSFGEVEGGEVMYKDNIYSNKVMIGNESASSLAKTMLENKAKLETSITKETNKYKVNAIVRKLTFADNDLDKLFQTQELEKENAVGNEQQTNPEGQPMFELGGNPYGFTSEIQKYLNDMKTVPLNMNKPYFDINAKQFKLDITNPNSKLPLTPFADNSKPFMSIKTNPALNGDFTNPNNVPIFSTKLPSTVFTPNPLESMIGNKLTKSKLGQLENPDFSITPNNTFGIKDNSSFVDEPFKMESKVGTIPEASTIPTTIERVKGDAGDMTTIKGVSKKGNGLSLSSDQKSKLMDAGILAANQLGNLISNEELKRIELPKHELTDKVSFDKNLDISAQLETIKNNESLIKDAITKNSSNSNIASAKINTAFLNSLAAKNEQFGAKVNYSNEVKNKEIAVNKDIETANNALVYDDKLSQFNKDVQTKFTNPSAMSADAYNKLNNLRTMSKQEDFQNMQLEINKQVNSHGANAVEFLGKDEKQIAKEYNVDQIDEYIKREANNPNKTYYNLLIKARALK